MATGSDDLFQLRMEAQERRRERERETADRLIADDAQRHYITRLHAQAFEEHLELLRQQPASTALPPPPPAGASFGDLVGEDTFGDIPALAKKYGVNKKRLYKLLTQEWRDQHEGDHIENPCPGRGKPQHLYRERVIKTEIEALLNCPPGNPPGEIGEST
jgi:hypothetical protein